MAGRQPALGLLGGDHGMRVALLLVAALLLSACTSDEKKEPAADDSPTPSATPPVAPPPPPPPTVGACYRLSYDEALAPTNADAPVPCTKPHTSQTFAIGELDLVANGHLLAVDSQAVRNQVAKRCPTELAPYLGATQDQLRLSLLRPVWFTPTIEESDLGAGWYRCDVIAVSGERTLAKFDRDLAKGLAKPAGRAEFAMCGTAEPGSKAFQHVLCREDHTWKAISVLDLSDLGRGGRYPGVKAVQQAGQDPCAEAARAIASDALDYEWGYEWPTADQWGAGQTYGRCWSPDPA